MTKSFHEPLLDAFTDRATPLQNIFRFSMIKPFYYASSVWLHEIRVSLLVVELSKIAVGLGIVINAEKARLTALVHDDAEIVMGDIQQGHKQYMTSQQLQEVDAQEATAIKKLAASSPLQLGDFIYEELLTDVLHKTSIEAQLVSYADRVDAYCESLHELFGGNILAVYPVLTYDRLLATYPNKFPDLKTLFAYKDSPLTNYKQMLKTDVIDLSLAAQLNKPHTRESIFSPTNYAVYNTWRSLILQGVSTEGLEYLSNRRQEAKL